MASRGRARRGNAAREQHRAGRTHTPATQGVAVVRDVQVLTTEHGLQPLQRMWRQIRGILR